jgi:hypothetical protein
MQCYTAGLGEHLGDLGQEPTPAPVSKVAGLSLEEIFLQEHPQGQVSRLLDVREGGSPEDWQVGSWAFRFLPAQAGGLLPEGMLEIIRVGYVIDVSLDPEHITVEEKKDQATFYQDLKSNPPGVENMLNVYKPPRVRRRDVGYIYGPRRGKMELWTLNNFNNGGWKLLTAEAVKRLIDEGVYVLRFDLPRDRIRPFTPGDFAKSLQIIEADLKLGNEMGRKGYPDRAVERLNFASQQATRAMDRSKVLKDAGIYSQQVFEYVNEQALKLDRTILKLQKTLVSQSYWKKLIQSKAAWNPWAGQISVMVNDAYQLYEEALAFMDSGIEGVRALLKHLLGIEENNRIIFTAYTKVKNAAKAVGLPVPPSVESALDEAVTWINGVTLIKYEIAKAIKKVGLDLSEAWEYLTGLKWEGSQPTAPPEMYGRDVKGLGEVGALTPIVASLMTGFTMAVLFAFYPMLMDSSVDNARNAEAALQAARSDQAADEDWIKASAKMIVQALANNPKSGITQDDVSVVEKAQEFALRATQEYVATVEGQLDDEQKAMVRGRTTAALQEWYDSLEDKAIIPPTSAVMIFADTIAPTVPPEGGLRSRAKKLSGETSPLLIAIPIIAMAGFAYYYFGNE